MILDAIEYTKFIKNWVVVWETLLKWVRMDLHVSMEVLALNWVLIWSSSVLHIISHLMLLVDIKSINVPVQGNKNTDCERVLTFLYEIFFWVYLKICHQLTSWSVSC